MPVLTARKRTRLKDDTKVIELIVQTYERIAESATAKMKVGKRLPGGADNLERWQTSVQLGS